MWSQIDLLLVVSSLGFMIFWLSSSPSIMLLSLFALSLLTGSISLILWGLWLPTYLFILTIVGGLFILISFVILSFPNDFDKNLIPPHSLIFWGSGLFLFFISMKESLKNLEGENYPLSFLSDELMWSIIVLLGVLILSLKIIDTMIVVKGSFFK